MTGSGTGAYKAAGVDIDAGNRAVQLLAESVASTRTTSVLADVLPELEGRLAASSMRVPISNGSIVDLTVTLRETVTPERVNTLMRSAAEGPYRNVLAYTEDRVLI